MFLLQVSTGGQGTSAAPAIVDFLNSADFTLIVPNGTVITNNPGGRLFQTQTPPDPGSSPVPEPESLLLVATGLASVGMKRWRRRPFDL